jgi:hypothetical protein
MKTRLALIIVLSTLLVAGISIGHSIAEQAPADPPPGGTLAQRVDQRKKERAIVLDKKEQTRLVGQCVKTQSKLRSIQQSAATIADNRAKTYLHIDADLWIVIGQLKLDDKDTFNLEKNRSQLASKVAAFVSTGTKYRQALDDTVVVNCEADIVGFKAMLDTTRIYYKQWSDQAEGIRLYVVNDIKNALSEYVKELQASETSGGGN